MENYQKAYKFDFVFDTQAVFRQMLDALSNPGTIKNIKKQSITFQHNQGVLAALGCTVLDNEKVMYVDDNQELKELLHDLTICHHGTLDQADYIFVSSELEYEILREIIKNAKKGTYVNPHESATIFILCQSILGVENAVMEGPGIKNKLFIGLDIYVKNIIAIREEENMEYPLGIDLFFVSKEGELMGIPRLCKVNEQEET